MHRTISMAVLVIAIAVSAQSQNPYPKPFVFYNPYTNMCLRPVNGSTVQGVAVVQQPCTNGGQDNLAGAQEWLYVESSNGFHFQNALSGLCLDARGGANNGTPVQQWTCNGISNENWEIFVNTKGGGAPVESRVSGTSSHCLDVPGAQKTAGLGMQIYVCNGTVAQKWLLNADGSLIVPNVTNLAALAAQNKVLQYGLTFELTNTGNCKSAQQGVVMEQLPGAGNYEAPNAAVTLYVCKLTGQKAPQ
jgi:hypothetical protein